MRFIGNVTVKFKSSVLEPQGKAVLLSLHEHEHTDIINVRIGKFVEVEIEADNVTAAENKMKLIAQELLCNPVVEVFECAIKEGKLKSSF